MKVLILSITAGQGHNSVAKAVADDLEQRGIETRIVDTYTYFNKLLGGTVSRGYLLSVDNAKTIYSKAYGHLEKRKKDANQNSATRQLNKVFKRKMKKLLDEFDPDVIVCTHIFPGIVVDILKAENMIRAKTVGILTDFAFHPYWEEVLHFDYVVTPNELLNFKAVKKGFKEEQILPLGIPIKSKFSSRTSKSEARKRLELDPEKTTVLLMSGSMGYGNIEKTVRSLDQMPLDFQLIVVCGNNEESKNKIDSLKTQKTVLNYGYIDFVDLLMDASDCIITKPGGITTSEALAKNLPIIIVNPIPGQEDRNTDFLLNNGVAMKVTPTLPLDEIIFEMFSNPDRVDLIRKSIELISKPNSTTDICDAIVKMAADRSENE